MAAGGRRRRSRSGGIKDPGASARYVLTGLPRRNPMVVFARKIDLEGAPESAGDGRALSPAGRYPAFLVLMP
jgi:hypothetical protein